MQTFFVQLATIEHNGRTFRESIYVENPYGVNRYYTYLAGMAGRFYLRFDGVKWLTI